jgi:uncharacterized protein YqeY
MTPAMSIEKTLDDDLKAAMRAHQADRVACVRQLRSKVQEAVNAKGFAGEVDDALYQSVISSYIKQLENGIEQMGSATERGVALCDKYRAEVAYLGQFLPKLLDAAATQKIVQKALEELKITDVKMAGRVLGHVLKQHKGLVDPAVARDLIAKALQG